ncbi:MAG: hypothetical protein AAGG68_00975 [Bacteroidota bacterium]
MPNRKILGNIRQAIASGKEQEAITLLTNYCSEQKYEDLHRSVLAVSGNLNTLLLKERNHTIALNEAMIEHNKIKERLLQITQEAERYANANYRRSKQLISAKNKASKGIPIFAYLLGVAILLSGLYYLGDYFFDKSAAHQETLNQKKDSLEMIGGDLQDLPLSTPLSEPKKVPVELEIDQFQSFYYNKIHPASATKRGSYQFPVIDFKFHNSGDAMAYIKEFHVDVLEYEVDETAILSMDFSYNPKAFNLSITNTGWGTAERCNCKIENADLSQLFDAQLLEFEKDISSVEEHNYQKEILYSLAADSADFSQINASQIEINQENTKVKCTYQNKGINREVVFSFRGTPLYLDTIGFQKEYEYDDINSLHVNPTANYLLYINSEEKTYRKDLLHKVEADELHRFQITIGNQQSCKVKLQFRFTTNEDRELKSKPFEVEIWRPKRVDTPIFRGDILKVVNS